MVKEPAPDLIRGTTKRLAVDRHHPAHRLCEALHSGDETTLKLLGVQSGEHDAGLVMRWHTMSERQKAAQERQTLLAIEGDFDPAIGATDDGAQTQQQDLLQRIEYPQSS